MPHLIVETSGTLAEAVDFGAAFRQVHARLAELGYAKLEDCKSRLLVAEVFLTGSGSGQEAVVAWLVTTVPRPPEAVQAMASEVQAILADCVRGAQRSSEIQVCVFSETTPPANYRKLLVKPPAVEVGGASG